jgi:hypothetical protein
MIVVASTSGVSSVVFEDGEKYDSSGRVNQRAGVHLPCWLAFAKPFFGAACRVAKY